MRVDDADHLAQVLGGRVVLRRDPELFVRVSRGVLARDVPMRPADGHDHAAALARVLGSRMRLDRHEDVFAHVSSGR
jgi:hypothetical protein